MEGDHIKIWHWLTPLSWLYGLGVWVRNLLYETGVLKSERFPLPVICVGNITVGGTGKTPHTEYLIRLLREHSKVAVLSRGYKRRTRGFWLAGPDTSMRDIGDEPFQMKEKFPDIRVAVCKDRCEGIRRLMRPGVQPPVDVVLLDDAFQFRRLSPGLTILLMDYHRLIYYDKLLPAGRLREPQSGRLRADVMVVTKCPTDITPMEQHGIARSLEVQPWQRIYFTTFRYADLLHMESGATLPLSALSDKTRRVVLLTGIASPRQMEYDLRKFCDFTPIHFADHHNFSAADLLRVEHLVAGLRADGRQVVVVTTEKDAARLSGFRTPSGSTVASYAFFHSLYVLPIRVEFIDNKQTQFDKIILNYVHENQRNGAIPEGAHDDKA